MQNQPPPSSDEPLSNAEELLRSSSFLNEYPSWNVFVGQETASKYSKPFIGRNNNIWELMTIESQYLSTLVMVRDVYLRPFPLKECINVPDPISTSIGEKASSLDMEDLLSNMEQAVALHTRLLDKLLQVHNQRKDKIVFNLGKCFVEVLDEQTLSNFIECYGKMMFTQARIKNKLQSLRTNATIANFLNCAKADPRTGRRILEDCYLIITQRWTKVETLLDSIISITIDDESSEIDDLEVSRELVQSLLKGAQSFMTKLNHAEKLRHFTENLMVDHVDSTYQDANLADRLRDPNAVLINHDVLMAEVKKSGKLSNCEVHGVALEDCFFLLQRMPDNRFQLFKELQLPSILVWGEEYGYFREDAGKALRFMILVVEPIAIVNRFTCATRDEMSRWKSILEKGFARWGQTSQRKSDGMADLSKNLSDCSMRWTFTESALNMMLRLDEVLLYDWHARTEAFATLFLQQSGREPIDFAISRANSAAASRSSDSLRNGRQSVSASMEVSPVSTDSRSPSAILAECTYLSKVSGVDNLRYWLDIFRDCICRLCLAVSTTGTSLGLIRSASDVADRRVSTAERDSFDIDYVATKVRGPGLSTSQPSFKIKKPDRRRLGSAMSNLLRAAGMDKSSPVSPTSTVEGIGRSRYSFSDAKFPSATLVPTSEDSERCVGDLLQLLNQAAEVICSCGYTYQTEFTKLEATVKHLTAENEAMSAVVRRQSSPAGRNRTCELSSADVRMETESLRQRYSDFEVERKNWQSKMQKQRAQIDKENQKLIQSKTEMEECKRQYEEDCLTLQRQIDMHESRGVDVGHLRKGVARGQGVDGETPLGSINSTPKSEAVFTSFTAGLPHHVRSSSDDLVLSSGPGSSFISPVSRQSTTTSETLSFRGSGQSDIPEHLRGGLVCQDSLNGNRGILYDGLYSSPIEDKTGGLPNSKPSSMENLSNRFDSQ